MKKIIFTFVFCLLMQGIVSAEITMKLVPAEQKGQKIVTQEGSEAIISHKGKSSVALRPPPDGYTPDGRPMILVSVYGTNQQYDFSAEEIKVFVDGNPHQVLTYDGYVKEIKQRQEIEVKALETKYDAMSNNIAQNSYKPSSSLESHNPSSSKNTVGSMSSGGYEYDISSLGRDQNQINAEMQAQKDTIEKRTAQELAVADSIMLKKTTVLPDTWYRGYFAIENIPDPAQTHKVKIIVTVAGEKHEFMFNHLKAHE
ncbi:MAG: hypothetical protein JW927_06530 [Deltaproteobacteria bacterium]|nr:hypothetical protein [Deltaproteobacteria bacterium]